MESRFTRKSHGKKNHKILAVKSAVKFRNSSVLQFPGPAALLGITSFRKKKTLCKYEIVFYEFEVPALTHCAVEMFKLCET